MCSNDIKITHTKDKIVQMDDYYPFGLAFNSFHREDSKTNNFLYNGKEMQDELDVNWMDYGARMYDPSLSRFMTVDPKAEMFVMQSPFAYAANDPIKYIDENGEGPIDPRTFKRPTLGITFEITKLYKKSNASTARDRAMRDWAGLMNLGSDGGTILNFRETPIAEGSQFIGRDGEDYTHRLTHGGESQIELVKLASEYGNYDVQEFDLLSDAQFKLKSVEDGIISGEATYTKNENGEYEKTESRSYDVKYSTKTVTKKTFFGKEYSQKVTSAETTETITNHKTGKVSTKIHKVKRAKVEDFY